MLIVMKPSASAQDVHAVVNVIQEIGLRPHPMPGATRTAIGITGNQGAIDGRRFENLPGVAEVIRVTKPYKLITLDLRPEKTVVRIGDATIGGSEFAIIAGPCAIESRDQAFAVAEAVQKSGARFFRGSVWKPRTSPYAFQGLGEKGWEIITEIRKAFGLKIVTEALEEPHIGLIEQYWRRHSDRRSQHAELFAPQASWSIATAGPVKARNGCNTRRMVARCRIHHGGGQLQRNPVRARRSDFHPTYT